MTTSAKPVCMLLLWTLLNLPIDLARADIGLLTFRKPELHFLLEQIEEEGNRVDTHIFGGRKFYATRYLGHNVVIANTGGGISNSAATTAIMLQKFPTIDRLIGSGVAGGVDPSIRIGDVVIPRRWSLYQNQHFAKVREDGSHDIPGWVNLIGTDCGLGTSSVCTPGVNTWNYSWIYPTASPTIDPSENRTIENSELSVWFDVDPEMYTIAESVAAGNVTMANSTWLDYIPRVVPGGNGISGPTFLDNALYREYLFDTFQAISADMESSAAANVAKQFGKKFIFFRSVGDLAGGEVGENSLDKFYPVAAENVIITLTAFLEVLPIRNISPEDIPIPPNDFSPGEGTRGLLGVLSFYGPELKLLREEMDSAIGVKEIIYGGRKFYRGKIGNADIVAAKTGDSVFNGAMTTALMLQLYPGIERIIGTGIAGGVNPELNLGDVVVPERWALYQNQVYSRQTQEGKYTPAGFLRDHLVGEECGGWNGVDKYLLGADPCDYTRGETHNFDFMFPMTIESPDPNAPDELLQISEGESRSWWLEADSEMYNTAMNALDGMKLTTIVDGDFQPYTPSVVVGGNGVSGSTFVDNVGYREYMFSAFSAHCVDMESAAAAHIAYQHDVPFLFFRSLSNLAGGDTDSNVLDIFFDTASVNAFSVTLAFIKELYPGAAEGATTKNEEKDIKSNSSSLSFQNKAMAISFFAYFCCYIFTFA